jgi:hypothetical protein
MKGGSTSSPPPHHPPMWRRGRSLAEDLGVICLPVCFQLKGFLNGGERGHLDNCRLPGHRSRSRRGRSGCRGGGGEESGEILQFSSGPRSGVGPFRSAPLQCPLIKDTTIPVPLPTFEPKETREVKVFWRKKEKIYRLLLTCPGF